jgi:hypothetical protein
MDRIVGNEGKIAMLEHLRSQWGYYGKSLHVKVAQHFVRAPPTEEANFVRVDRSAQEGHGAGGAEGPDADVAWANAPLCSNG